MRLYVTMTAVMRSDLLRRTLASFGKNLFAPAAKAGWTISFFVNVDPVGPDKSPKSIQDVFRETSYAHGVYFYFAQNCNFGAAVKKAWGLASLAPRPGLVLHLEDDWDLARPVDPFHVLSIFKGERRLASLRLPAVSSQESSIDIGDGIVFPWNGLFFECPEEMNPRRAISLNPTFFDPAFLFSCAGLLDPDLNPEKQFWTGNPRLSEYVAKWRHGIYGGLGMPALVHDTGRTWRSAHGFRKENDSPHFIRWSKK